MADSLSIPPVNFTGLAGIPAVGFQLLTGSTSTSTASIFSTRSTAVELSSSGQLLSAVSSFRDDLQTLQTNNSGNSTAALGATAQGLVDSFNGLQADTASVQAIFTAEADNTLASQLALSLNELTAASIATGTANLGNLQAIGIELQAAPAPATLLIDFTQLNAAIAADPVGTQTTLATATQSLIDLADDIESQVADNVVAQSNLIQLGSTTAQADLNAIFGLPATASTQGAGVATELLQNVSADTVLNAIPTTDLDLAAAGLEAGTLPTDASVLPETLAAAQLTPEDVATVIAELPLTTNPIADELRQGVVTLAAATPPAVPANAPIVEPPVVTAQAVPVANAIPAATTAAITDPAVPIDVIAAERRLSAVTLNLQTQASDPSLRAIDNFNDPLFAALIAASHLSDFVSTEPAINPAALVNTATAPVLAAQRAFGIDYYAAEAGETWSQVARPGEPLQWYA